jgi:hypothetical protein
MRRLPFLLAAAASGVLLSGSAFAQPPGQAQPDTGAAASRAAPDQGAAPDQAPPPDSTTALPSGQRRHAKPQAGDAASSGQDTSATSGEAPPKHRHKSFDYGQTDDGMTGTPPPSDDAAPADQPGPNAGEAPPRSH